MAKTSIVGVGANIAVTGFNLKPSAWSHQFSSGLNNTTGFADLGVSTHEQTVNSCTGTFSGVVLDATGATIQGPSGLVTLPGGYNGKIVSWDATFSITAVDVHDLTEAWTDVRPTWCDLSVSLQAIGISEGDWLPSDQYANNGNNKAAAVVLQAATNCSITIPTLAISGASYSRTPAGRMDVGLTGVNHSMFHMTWGANAPCPVASLSDTTGFSPATWIAAFTETTKAAKTYTGNVCITQLSLHRDNAQGSFMSYAGQWVNSGAITQT